MNAAMANSMASKLTDAELNAIILMTERLRQKELLAKQLTDEKEKLAAQLDGTESVKQFLVAKIRDMETAISATVENETKVAQQIASDQEVIAFLDGRVQDLERENTVLLKEKAATLEQLQKAQQNSTEKAAVMGDMLQFEREKLFENEREWKATKKLLVKEVKSCRNQIAALQAECDGVREQNEILRKTVLSASQSSPTMAKDRVYT
jgi:chromosome segregation ATPase